MQKDCQGAMCVLAVHVRRNRKRMEGLGGMEPGDGRKIRMVPDTSGPLQGWVRGQIVACKGWECTV